MLGDVLRRLLGSSKRAPGLDFAGVYRLLQERRLEEAERACDAIRDTPRADVDFLRGLIAHKRGNLDAAAAAMTAAAEARPDEPAFRDALATVLLARGEHRQALEHLGRFFECADANDARRLAAYVKAGQCCLALGDGEAAQSWFERALRMESADEGSRLTISGALYDSLMAEEARTAIGAGPSRPAYAARLRRALMLPGVYQDREHIEATRERLARELDELLEEPAERIADPVSQIGVTPFYLAYHNANNVELLKKVCRTLRRAYRAPQRTGPDPKRARRVRIGFVSTHFYSHSVARALACGLIRDLPRESFDVHVFAVAPQDDAMSEGIARASDHYLRLPLELERVRQSIEGARLDVLVFTDIGMHPLTYFLAFSRLAPVQIATWGHSETTGIDTIDYYLSADGVEIPQAQEHYCERLLRPRAFFLAGHPPPTPPEQADREALGLPIGPRLYACLQPVFKLHPDIDAVFGQILERDPRAEILLVESKPGWARPLKRRFSRTLAAHVSRLRFLPPMPHRRFLATLARADVALDPLYFGGCNASVETLTLGVPVVTLPGTHLYGRFTLGLYEELGVRECIATTAEDYVEKALRLAADREYREALSLQLRERAHLMFERRDVTVAFGRFISEELL